jgi:hypothetical protein
LLSAQQYSTAIVDPGVHPSSRKPVPKAACPSREIWPPAKPNRRLSRRAANGEQGETEGDENGTAIHQSINQSRCETRMHHGASKTLSRA